MHGLIHHVYVVLAHMGGFGLLALSFLDSSPLFFPFGNDLMMIAMTAGKHRLIFYYGAMAAAGSVLGSFTVDALSRKGGEKGLDKTMSKRRLEYVKRRIRKSAAWALIIACLMPPPFPFTGFVAATAALQYPRKKLLTVVFFSRLFRFLVDGVLAMLFSARLLRFARSRTAEYVGMFLVIVYLVGTLVVVIQFVKRARKHPSGEESRRK